MVKTLVADETGLIKLINLKSKDIVAKCRQQSRSASIACIAWVPTSPQDNDEFPISCTRCASITKTGIIEVWDVVAQKLVHRCTNAGTNPVLLACWRGNFITCNTAGELRRFPLSSVDASSEQSVLINVGANVGVARLHHGTGILAVGGQEHELTLWDVATGKESWRAQNVGHDNLDMRMPVWVKSIAFLPSTPVAPFGSAIPATCSYVLAIATHYRGVRVYQTAVQRRPVREVQVGEYPLNCVASSPDGRYLVTGDSSGVLRRFDAALLKENGVFRGPAGSIRALAFHPDTAVPYVAAVGLDRTLRVYNSDSRQLVRHIPLKQRLIAVSFALNESAVVPGKGKAPRKSNDVAAAEDIEPEGPKPNAGGGTRLLVWREYAVKENARKAATIAAAAEGGPLAGAAVEEDVWSELDRRAAVVKRGRSDEDDEESDDDEDDDEEEEEEFDGDEDDDEEDEEEDDEEEDVASQSTKQTGQKGSSGFSSAAAKPVAKKPRR